MVNILALLGIGSDFMDLVVADSVIVSDHEGRYGWLFDRTNESRCSGSILISQNKSFLYVIKRELLKTLILIAFHALLVSAKYLNPFQSNTTIPALPS